MRPLGYYLKKRRENGTLRSFGRIKWYSHDGN
jgi:hypothetical protein